MLIKHFKFIILIHMENLIKYNNFLAAQIYFCIINCGWLYFRKLSVALVNCHCHKGFGTINYSMLWFIEIEK